MLSIEGLENIYDTTSIQHSVRIHVMLNKLENFRISFKPPLPEQYCTLILINYTFLKVSSNEALVIYTI